MDLLPLIEMYCRWELQEECGNLRALMDRFDSEASLQTTELGRSLLLMLRDDDDGLQFRAPRQESSPPLNPFAAIRGRLAAVDRAFQGLHAQVLPSVDIGLGVSTVLSVHLSPALADILRSSGRPITCNPNFVSGTPCRPRAGTSILHPLLVFAIACVCACIPLCICFHSSCPLPGINFRGQLFSRASLWFPGGPPACTPCEGYGRNPAIQLSGLSSPLRYLCGCVCMRISFEFCGGSAVCTGNDEWGFFFHFG